MKRFFHGLNVENYIEFTIGFANFSFVLRPALSKFQSTFL